MVWCECAGVRRTVVFALGVSRLNWRVDGRTREEKAG